MKLYYNSPCSQCHYADKCHESHKEARSQKIKKFFSERGVARLQGMSDTDCFKSPERIKREFKTMPAWKQKLVEEHKKRECFGKYIHCEDCSACHVYDDCLFITKRSMSKED